MYSDPSVVLVLKRPKSTRQISGLLENYSPIVIPENRATLDSFMIVESVIHPMLAKLRLSPITTPTSIIANPTSLVMNTTSLLRVDDPECDLRRQLSFQIVTPTEVYTLTIADDDPTSDKTPEDWTRIHAETGAWERALRATLKSGHGGDLDEHRIVLGTLHSIVLLNEQKLEDVIARTDFLRDDVDECGRTALHLACTSRNARAVAALLRHSADSNVEMPGEISLLHLCAKNLDYKSLSILLAAKANHQLNPNQKDVRRRTPMHVAMLEGKCKGGREDIFALERSLEAL